MNVRKRGLALLMCICMIFTLLPFSALADATTQDVVYGTYGDDGKWNEDNTLTAENSVKHYPAPGETSDSKANIDYSKTAVKSDDGSYNVTLTIKSKTSETAPDASAVVLVIDTSGSMGDYQRLAKAKEVAKKFVNDYGTSGKDRYIAIVEFASNADKLNFGGLGILIPEVYWLDASNADNRNAINKAIANMDAGGGTNLEQGLSVANSLLSYSKVSKIAKSNKFVIALTDGEPTYAYSGWDKKGDGTYCDASICEATETTATTLKGNVNTLYTVCYGAENDGTYEGGLTVGEFLKQKIASPGEAYNATDSENSLSEAFAKIYESIKHGISSGFTVTDPMGKYVELQNSTLPDSTISNGTITTIKWEPKNGTTVEDSTGSKTTTYTLTYRVTLGEVPENGTYPLNKDTTLEFKDGNADKTLHFNVPGVYREAPKYTVTYAKGEHGNLEGQDNSGNVVYPNLKKGALTPDAPKVNAADGYYFTGWDKEIAATVTADAVYTAQYEKKNEITVVANSDEVTYDGKEHSVSGFEQTEFTINGKVYTVSGLDASASGTDANTYTNAVTGTAVVTDADGKNVTNRFTVNTQDGELKIKPIEITLTSASDQKQYDGTPLTNSNVTVTKGAFVDGEGYTANVTGSQTLVGSSDNTFTYTLNEGTKAQNYVIEKSFGELKVIDRTEKYEITVVANSDEVTYDGEVHSVSGFKTLSFTVEGNTYTVSGLDASVSGTDANTYTNAVTGTAVVTDAAGNDVTGQFTVKTQDGTLTIKPAEVTITADNKEKFVDEADPEFTYTISGIVEADKDKKVTLTIIREKVGTPEGEQAGSYSIIPKDASIEGSNNYTFKYVNGTLTIKERNAITVTLTATKLLDGENATGSEFEFELYQIVEGKEVRIEKVKNNNAAINFTPIQFNKEGTYTYYMREVGGGDQYIKYDDTVYKIVITVEKGADGNYEVKSQTYTVVSESDEAVPLDSIIFNNTTKTGSLIISKVVAGNAADKNKEFTFTLTLSENGEIMPGEVKYGGFTFKDGKYTFKLKNGGDEIFTGLPVGTTYTITESDNSGYTVSAEVSTTGGYEPMKVTDNAVSGTIIEHNTDVKFTNTKNSTPVNPGIYTEITVEITGNSDSVVYDGTEHSVKGYTVKISDPRYTEADFTFTGKAEASGVNAGTYEMGLKAEQFKNTNARFTNVKFVIKADGVLTITPKDLTITAGSKTEYGPTPVTCDEWTVSGLVAGDKVESVKITGIQSVPGSSPNVPSDAVIKNAKGEDVTKNYAIKYVNGTLTMLEVLNKEDHFNYIIGTPEGLSLPTANVTRAEVATIFFRLMTDDARAKFDSLDNNFSDVAKGKWYNRAISTLAKAGIIKGDPAGTYRPDDPITRAEMAAIIARFGDFKEGGKTFNDISGHWAQKYIELAASNGWINGNPDGTFKPNNNITRAETVAMINRVLDRQTKDVSDLLPVSQMTNWSDNMDTAKWYYRDMQEATNNHKAERVGNSIYEKWTEKLPDIDWASYQI